MSAPTVAPRDHMDTVRTLAAKASHPASLTLRCLALELAEVGVTVSSTKLQELAGRIVTAQAYSEALGLE